MLHMLYIYVYYMQHASHTPDRAIHALPFYVNIKSYCLKTVQFFRTILIFSFSRHLKLNYLSVLTTDTALVKWLYCCMIHFPCSFLLLAATLKSIDYNVAMTFILNNNNNTLTKSISNTDKRQTFVSFDGPLQSSCGFILSPLSPKLRFFFIASRPSVGSKALIKTAVPSPTTNTYAPVTHT